ncbi:MAG: hypothetical protein ACJ73E_17470, partial [Mycobacteriales bacterium]
KEYMRDNLSRLRADIAYGARVESDEIQLIYQGADASSPEIAWEAFFVLAARHSEQPPRALIEAFLFAWRPNAGRTDRWKLINKMASRGLLLEEEVIAEIIGGDVPKEWEVLLGSLLEDAYRHEGGSALRELAGSRLNVIAGHASEGPWRQVRGLLRLLLADETFVQGDVF